MLMNGARPVPEATNSARRPSSWSRNLPFGPVMLIGVADRPLPEQRREAALVHEADEELVLAEVVGR